MKDLVVCKLEGETFFSSESDRIRDEFVKILITFPCTITDVITQNSKGEKRNAKKFVVEQLEMIKLIDALFLLWINPGTIILIYQK